MNPSHFSHAGTFTVAAMVASFAAFNALAVDDAPPTSVLYLTKSDVIDFESVRSIVRIDGDRIDEVAARFDRESSIVVNGRIRTVGLFSGEEGGQYDLDLTPDPDRAFTHTLDGRVYDATTDGTSIYALDHTSGDVIRFKPDWSRPRVLFNLGEVTHLGITYDPSNHSLWIAGFYLSDTIKNFDMEGNLLSEFRVPDFVPEFLALDHADGLLWCGDDNIPGVYYGLSKSGELLRTASYDIGTEFVHTWAAEFDLGGAAKIRKVKIERGERIDGSKKSLRKPDQNRLRVRSERAGHGSRISCEIRCAGRASSKVRRWTLPSTAASTRAAGAARCS